jgi:alkylated DNA nucleotide flippase Atl1
MMEIDLASADIGSARDRIVRTVESIPDGKAWTLDDVAEKSGTNREYVRRVCRDLGVSMKVRVDGVVAWAACNKKTAAEYGS